jgi:succinate dehydrogenase/fumarate reductase flavoprotein subunit
MILIYQEDFLAMALAAIRKRYNYVSFQLSRKRERERPMNVVETDVLVVGGGNSGLSAAIGASGSAGLKVLVASKTLIPGGASVMYGGHHNAAGLGPFSGSVNDLFNDTIRKGQYLNNQGMVRICLEEIRERIIEIERFGGMWPRQEKPDQYKIDNNLRFGHSKYHQVHNPYPWQVARALKEEATKRGVEFLPEVMITGLQKSNHAVSSALGIDIKTGKCMLFRVKSTILATGGGTQLYKRARCHRSLTGDGYAIALRAGAELSNMEFVEWAFPVNVKPRLLAGSRYVITFITLDENHVGKIRFLNTSGERFMQNYDPTWMELAAEKVACRAIFEEIRAGRGTEHDGVFVDLSELPKEENRRWRESLDPQTIDRLQEVLDQKEIEWEKPIELGVAARHMPGGVRTNVNGETNIIGLYAVGEVSSGMHGAERLGGNCDGAECLVMGRRAGISAAEYALKVKMSEIDWTQVENERKRIFAPLNREEGVQPFEIKTYLQDLMYRSVGIVRNKQDLEAADREIHLLKKKARDHLYTANKKARYNSEWITAIELLNMLECAEIVTKAALFRTESRAGHYRKDCPQRNDENWVVETGIQVIGKGKTHIYRLPIDPTFLKPGEVGYPEDWLPWRYPNGISRA